MKGNFLMRVLFCKIHCPFICFSKHSATHIYTPQPLNLEKTTPDDPVTPTPIPISDDSSDQSDKSDKSQKSDNSKSSSPEVREEVVNENQETIDVIILKSCIRKTDNIAVDDDDDAKEMVKKKVKWIDSVGEELVEIKEFESSDTGDTDSEEGNSCVCTIL